MTDLTAPIVDHSGNFAVVQMPGRSFPALAIPGDSYHGLCKDLSDLVKGLEESLGPQHEQTENARAILAGLWERLEFYESVLSVSGRPLPYTTPEQP